MKISSLKSTIQKSPSQYHDYNLLKLKLLWEKVKLMSKFKDEWNQDQSSTTKLEHDEIETLSTKLLHLKFKD